MALHFQALITLFFALSFVTSAPTQSTPNDNCPKDWDQYGSNCYRSLFSTWTFSQNEDYCKSLNATMVSVFDSQQNEFLRRKILEKFTAWIGAKVTNGDFTWSDGSTVNYTNWAPGQPECQKECCVSLNSTDGKWYDEECHYGSIQLCQKSVELEKATTTAATESHSAATRVDTIVAKATRKQTDAPTSSATVGTTTATVGTTTATVGTSSATVGTTTATVGTTATKVGTTETTPTVGTTATTAIRGTTEDVVPEDDLRLRMDELDRKLALLNETLQELKNSKPECENPTNSTGIHYRLIQKMFLDVPLKK